VQQNLAEFRKLLRPAEGEGQIGARLRSLLRGRGEKQSPWPRSALLLSSAADALNLARRDRCNHGKNRRHERSEVLQAIGCGAHDENSERKHRNWLLGLDATVHRDQNIVVAAHPAQELAILDAGPPATDHRVNIVAAAFRSEVYRKVFVKKDAH
jgi:hypothetical protein